MMKHFLSILALMLVFASAAIAQDQSQNKIDKEEKGPMPVMTFEQTEVDYGTIEQGSDPYRTFVFTNTGDAPLIIKSARGSCGCTVPEYSKEPVMPGEKSEIKVRYDTNRLNAFTKTVTLTTNADPGQVVLRIKGKVVKPAPEPAGVGGAEKNVFNNGGNN
jgi:hypothetical protein